MKERLICDIVSDYTDNHSSYCRYVVTDKNNMVLAEGVSSSPEWVRYDAGGHHTQKKFDELYPDGWEVSFNFKSQ